MIVEGMMSPIEVKVSNYKIPNGGTALQFEILAELGPQFKDKKFTIIQDTLYDWRIVPDNAGRNWFTARSQGRYIGMRKTVNIALPLFGRSPCKAGVTREGVIHVQLLPDKFEQVKEWRDAEGRHSPEYLGSLLRDIKAAQWANCGFKLYAETVDDMGRTISVEVNRLYWEPILKRIWGDEE